MANPVGSGLGVGVEYNSDTGAPSTLHLVGSLIEKSREMGVWVLAFSFRHLGLCILLDNGSIFTGKEQYAHHPLPRSRRLRQNRPRHRQHPRCAGR